MQASPAHNARTNQPSSFIPFTDGTSLSWIVCIVDRLLFSILPAFIVCSSQSPIVYDMLPSGTIEQFQFPTLGLLTAGWLPISTHVKVKPLAVPISFPANFLGVNNGMGSCLSNPPLKDSSNGPRIDCIYARASYGQPSPEAALTRPGSLSGWIISMCTSIMESSKVASRNDPPAWSHCSIFIEFGGWYALRSISVLTPLGVDLTSLFYNGSDSYVEDSYVESIADKNYIQ